MGSDFMKYFKMIPNSNKCNCVISGCKSQKLTNIKGNLKRYIIDIHPSLAKTLNVSVKKRVHSSNNSTSNNEKKLSTNDLIRICVGLISIDRCPE